MHFFLASLVHNLSNILYWPLQESTTMSNLNHTPLATSIVFYRHWHQFLRHSKNIYNAIEYLPKLYYCCWTSDGIIWFFSWKYQQPGLIPKHIKDSFDSWKILDFIISHTYEQNPHKLYVYLFLEWVLSTKLGFASCTNWNMNNCYHAYIRAFAA